MNYFLFYSGNLPKYYKVTLNNILSVDKNAKIYFCSDEKIFSEYITHVDPSKLKSEFISEIQRIDYFKNFSNPLWNTSLLRIFYLLEMSKKFNISKFIHFDLDVMIYKSFSELKDYFDENKMKCQFTHSMDLCRL